MKMDIKNNICLLALLLLGFVLASEVVAENSSLSIHSYSIISDIKFRYATTRVESVFINTRESAAEAIFHVNIPENAFVSNFTMEINGSVFVGNVLEKEKAKTIYDKAAQRGETAGYIGTEHRNTNLFDVRVSVEASNTIIFRLTYQELLNRKLGKYQHTIHLTNKQIIEDFKLEIFITDLRSIKLDKPELKSDSLKENNNSLMEAKGLKEVGKVEYLSSKQIYISYKPNATEQKAFCACGITGLFEINYDVDWKESPSMIYAIDGYFVHFYAPDSFPLLQKNILFILDVSGSMLGSKMKQMKEAMYGILRSLKEDLDSFLIGKFNSDIVWVAEDFLPANDKNINTALNYINQLSAEGGTNIYDTLLSGLRKFHHLDSNDTKNIIFFLTDGEPTNSIVDLDHIMRDVKKANKDVSIFTLGFGEGSNMNFLKQLAGENGGFGRKIYVAADSRLQISNLYQEISRILLKNIDIIYLDDAVNKTTITQSSFSIYFQGSEIVIAGALTKELNDDIKVLLTMDTSLGETSETLKLPIYTFELGNEDIPENPKLTTLQSVHTITRNTWVHLTLKRLLNSERTPEIEKQIISIALKYGFVTPLTSMVVVEDIKGRSFRSFRNIKKITSAVYGLSYSDTNISCFSLYLLLAICCFQMYIQNW